MTHIPLAQAQKDLPSLIRRALEGEDIVIAGEDQRPAVRLSAVPPAFDEEMARRRGYGSLAGQFEVTDAFFEPLSDEECGFGGEGDK